MLEARGVVKRFGKKEHAVTALRGLDLEVQEGELFGLIGPNGSGKTTLIRILTGLESATEGHVALGGKPPGAMNDKVGYMPQEEALYNDLSILENVEFFAGLYADPDPKEIQRTLEFVRLWDVRDRLVGDCSGGMRRRVSLASTLIHHPRILFLDEPTVGVDPLLRIELWDQFHEIAKQGASILITTHHMEEAKRCDRIGFIAKGVVFVTGPTQRLLAEAGAKDLEDAFVYHHRRAGLG